MADKVRYERDGHVATITYHRPEAMNALNQELRDDLDAAWARFREDDDAWVAIVTGAGRAFCAGHDLKGGAVPRGTTHWETPSLTSLENGLEVWKPVIAAVNGVCAGGGLHFVADADIVIASSAATFTDPHVSLGQVSAFETIGLTRRSPMEPVVRLALVGRHERVTAARAYELGIVSEVVDPPERLREVAQELAETIARNSPAAMTATKRALWGAFERGLTGACRAGAAELVALWGHPDQTEGPRAFAERREPRWST
jgi:enoyl-CoA hydratase